MIGVLAAGWLLFTVAFLFLWGGFHAHIRSAEGIDEVKYVDGLDENSLAEAA